MNPRIFDLHLDSILQKRLFGYDLTKRHRAGIGGQPLFWHADLPRMREANYAGACMGVHYWPVESERGWREALRQLDVLDELNRSDAGLHHLVERPGFSKRSDIGSDDVMTLCAGVEGAHMLNGKLERVAELARRDVAYLTLTHFSANRAATPSLGRGANETDGLSSWGAELIRELNTHRIAVDTAHTNEKCRLDACAVSAQPVLCTHTGVKAVCDHPRNISDEALVAIAATEGIVGVLVGSYFLTRRHRADSTAVANHIDHIVQTVGIQVAAIGTDYDGWLPTIVRDQRDCTDFSVVWELLDKRGYSSEAIHLIASGNAERCFKAIRSTPT